MSRRSGDDRGPEEFDVSASELERDLRRLTPAAIPAGLRERVLDRAVQARRNAALAPWMRVAAVACSALVITLLALDPLLGRHEEARLAALLDGRRASVAAPEMTQEMADVGLGPGTTAERWERLQVLAAAAARRPPDRVSLEALERLKGRWEYEDLENFY